MEYCPICDSGLEYVEVHDKWHCWNCDKYFMQVVDEPEPVQKPPKSSIGTYSKGRLAAVLFIVIMMIIGTVICGILATPEKESNNEEGDIENDQDNGVLNIVSVSYTPHDPQADDEIIVTARIENCVGASMEFFSYFASGMGGGGTMEHLGGGVYEDYFRSFDDGSEIWFIVIAGDGDGNFQVSDEIIIQVGEIERSDISLLSINNIDYDPRTPKVSDRRIDVSAEITSDRTIEYVNFFHLVITHGSSFGGGGSFSDYDGDNIHEGSFSLGDNPTDGTIIYFKFAAQDESGNTAVTTTYKLKIS